MKLKEAEAVLQEQIAAITASSHIVRKLHETAQEYLALIQEGLKKKNISAEVFLGGSLAKGTIIKKDVYDIDLFVRFINYDNEKISKALEKVLSHKFKKVHGSRDYFQLRKGDVLIEVIPVMKIGSPKEAQNVTDLSYFHVNYVMNKTRQSPRLKEEIIIAKNFCYAQHCYGAEGYVKGFSGYALELLICHYGSFLQLMKAIVELGGKEKLIIDDSQFYESRQQVLTELNPSKQLSPIILIDPTYKERNALSGLSEETFLRFKEACRKFLDKPRMEFFEYQQISERFDEKKSIVLQVRTIKQAGDIAGTKSKKFFDFFQGQLEKEFVVKKSDFDYKEKENMAYFYFIVEKKKEETVRGPALAYPKNVKQFKKAHPKSFEKNGFMYTMVSHSMSFDEWLVFFLKKYKPVIKEMGMKKVERKK
ncbi:MAG: hypothetical protein RL557_119 [archaeon]|jgi:tRNA nucleotidyltransferase (CCA-adding enzyme)